jgi:hypothetical protein
MENLETEWKKMKSEVGEIFSEDVIYAYFRPRKEEEDFFVHVSVVNKEEANQTTIHYYKSWMKQDTSGDNILKTWVQLIDTFPGIKSSRREPGHREGRAKVDRKLLENVFGDKDIVKCCPDKTEADVVLRVSESFKWIEVTLTMGLPDLSSSVCNLPSFSNNPELETVNPKIAFFSFENLTL